MRAQVLSEALLKALIVFIAIMRIAIRHRRRHPFARFGPANQVTALRAALASFVAGLIGEPVSPFVANLAVAIALTCTVLDGMDGYLARLTRMASAFGARFDLEIDALLILVLAILVWQHGKAGPWILLSGLLRYLFVAAGWVWPWIARPLPSSLRGKAICVVQIVALLVALLPSVPPALSAPIAAVSLAALSASFLIDTAWLWRTR